MFICRYTTSFQTVVPMDGTTRSSKALQVSYTSSFLQSLNLFMYLGRYFWISIELSKNVQPPQFIPQPRPKRCATHHYIACNIRLQQQFTKMSHFWPAAAISAAPCGVKPKNLNAMPSAENIIIRHPSQGSFPVVTAQDKVQAVSNIPDFTRNARGSESAATLINTSQKKQLVLHQPPQPAPAGNLMVCSCPVPWSWIYLVYM